MDIVKEMPVQNRGEIRMLKMVIRQMAKKINLKKMLLMVGDLYVQSTRNTTDDKVWKEAKTFINKL